MHKLSSRKILQILAVFSAGVLTTLVLFAFTENQHTGSSIGYHLQETDEVYYVLGGSPYY